MAKTPSEADRIEALARQTLVQYVEDEGSREAAAAAARTALPNDVIERLDALLANPDSYRDALLVLLAVPLVRGQPTILTKRQSGWRSASRGIGRVLRELHIRGVNESFENIGKNSPALVRGNNDAFDETLRWASRIATLIDEGTDGGVAEANTGAMNEELDAVQHAYRYVSAGVAATARTVLPRPRLRFAALTFARVMGVLEETLAAPSSGAHEQYVIAALLEALLSDSGTRVTTKSLNASDRSSRTAGDVEVVARGRLLEGIEISANDWREKLAQAEAIVREHGLPRAHVVAAVDREGVYVELAAATDRDVSVLDVRATVPVLVAFLDRRGRESALLRLYELLDEHLASPELVNRYVTRLRDAELAGE